MNRQEEMLKKLLDVIDEQQHRIEKLEASFIGLVRVMKKMKEEIDRVD